MCPLPSTTNSAERRSSGGADRQSRRPDVDALVVDRARRSHPRSRRRTGGIRCGGAQVGAGLRFRSHCPDAVPSSMLPCGHDRRSTSSRLPARPTAREVASPPFPRARRRSRHGEQRPKRCGNVSPSAVKSPLGARRPERARGFIDVRRGPTTATGDVAAERQPPDRAHVSAPPTAVRGWHAVRAISISSASTRVARARERRPEVLHVPEHRQQNRDARAWRQ